MVLKETLMCDGKSNCDAPRNPTNKKMRCAVVARFAVNLQDLNVAYIYVKGQHGQRFKLNVKAMRMAPHVREQILQADGLDYGTGGRTTAMKEVLRLQELARGDRTTPDVVPTLRQVQNLLNYERRKAGRGRGTIGAMLERTLRDEHVSPFVLYPAPEDKSVSEEIEEGRPFLIVMIGRVCVPLVRDYGQVIGLDGVFKIDRNHWPIYCVAVEDEEGHGWPVAFFFTSCESKDIIGRGLRILRDHVRGELGEEWAPYVMIDHDEAERAAVSSLGWQHLLCEFHVQKAWHEKLTEFSRQY